MRVILSCLLLVGLALAMPEEKKLTIVVYETFDLGEIFNNDLLYKKYFECLANKGSCTPDGKKLKEFIPDALRNSCAKCSEKQKSAIEKIFRYLLEKKRADYNVLEKIYDPAGIYKKKYQAEAKKRGIKL